MADTETIPDDIMAIAVVVVDDAADECKRQKLMFGFPTGHGKEVLDEYIARALMSERLSSEARQKEADARIADDYALEKEVAAPFEDTLDYQERMLVYAKHVRRVARRIRNQETGK